jgi:hypothetical protein
MPPCAGTERVRVPHDLISAIATGRRGFALNAFTIGGSTAASRTGYSRGAHTEFAAIVICLIVCIPMVRYCTLTVQRSAGFRNPLSHHNRLREGLSS